MVCRLTLDRLEEQSSDYRQDLELTRVFGIESERAIRSATVFVTQ